MLRFGTKTLSYWGTLTHVWNFWMCFVAWLRLCWIPPNTVCSVKNWNVCKNHAICSPWHLHGVLSEIDDPVDQVKGAKGKREEDAGVFVDDAGAGQNVVVWYSRTLLQEGLGIDGWVGKCFGRPFKQKGRVHPLLQHIARIHLGEAERKSIDLLEAIGIKENVTWFNTWVFRIKVVLYFFQRVRTSS